MTNASAQICVEAFSYVNMLCIFGFMREKM